MHTFQIKPPPTTKMTPYRYNTFLYIFLFDLSVERKAREELQELMVVQDSRVMRVWPDHREPEVWRGNEDNQEPLVPEVYLWVHRFVTLFIFEWKCLLCSCCLCCSQFNLIGAQDEWREDPWDLLCYGWRHDISFVNNHFKSPSSTLFSFINVN